MFSIDVDFLNWYEWIEEEILIRLSLKGNLSVTDAELVIELKVGANLRSRAHGINSA